MNTKGLDETECDDRIAPYILPSAAEKEGATWGYRDQEPCLVFPKPPSEQFLVSCYNDVIDGQPCCIYTYQDQDGNNRNVKIFVISQESNQVTMPLVLNKTEAFVALEQGTASKDGPLTTKVDTSPPLPRLGNPDLYHEAQPVTIMTHNENLLASPKVPESEYVFDAPRALPKPNEPNLTIPVYDDNRNPFNPTAAGQHRMRTVTLGVDGDGNKRKVIMLGDSVIGAAEMSITKPVEPKVLGMTRIELRIAIAATLLAISIIGGIIYYKHSQNSQLTNQSEEPVPITPIQM